MTTLTTVGFGDIAPESGVEQFVAIVVMMIGFLLTAFGVSHVVQMTNEFSADTREFRLKLDRMNMYMDQVKLPNELRLEVREFLHQIGKKLKERSLQREEESLLSELSVGLRAKLAHAINHYYLSKVPFFSGIEDDDFTSRCARVEYFLFQTALRTRDPISYLPI